MKQVAGRPVFTELAEMVDPQHTAVLVVDMQNEFLSPGGCVARLTGKTGMVERREQLVSRISGLLDQARESGAMVIFIQQTQLPDLRNESGPWMHMLYSKIGQSPDVPRCRLDSWGREIDAELTPKEGDVIVHKWRSTAFAGTNLDIILRANNIKTVVICGVATDGCVMATAMHAFFVDYYVVLTPDACAAGTEARHRAAMAHMDNWLNLLAGTEDVKAAWRAAKQPLPRA